MQSNTEATGRYHSNWLNMMYPRLYLARNLMRDDGAIFISVDDHEVHNLRESMNEIFGEENFVACVANINNPKGRSDDKYFPTAHEYVVVYRRPNLSLRGLQPGKHVLRRYNKVEEGRQYREIDLRKTGTNDRREDRPNLFYYFHFNPESGELRPSRDEDPPNGWLSIYPTRDDGTEGNWRWELDTARARLADLTAKIMPVRKTWTVFEKDWLAPDERVKPTTAFTSTEVNSERGAEELLSLDFPKEIFPNPKPLGLLSTLVEMTLAPDAGDIILDFFAGSGTTAHAVMNLNVTESQNEGGTRRFILVQLPEPLDETKTLSDGTTLDTIADITRERVRRAGRKIREEHAEAIASRTTPLDTGFRAYKLAPSNFRPWDGVIPQGGIAQQLSLAASHIEAAADNDAMLAELLLRLGYELTVPAQLEMVAGKRVHNVDQGALLICLEREITLDLIEQLAARKPTPAEIICLDAGFRDDQTKVNAGQIIASHARDEEISIAFKVV